MASSIAQPTRRVVRNYHHDLTAALDLVSGVMMDVQNRTVAAGLSDSAVIVDAPWRDAADRFVYDLKPLVLALGITLAPSPDAPLELLKDTLT